MAKLLYQGHGSYRFTTNENVVIYVDPYIGAGYDLPADIILVTHQHGDHNQIGMVTQNSSCNIIQNQDALKDGIYQEFSIRGLEIKAVPGYNSNHNKNESVGYILTMNDTKIYCSGDISTMEEMKEFASFHLDYALLPIDGIYNMDPQEATACAELIGAKHTIPIHMKPGALFDGEMAEKFTAKNRKIVKAGEEIEL